MFIKSFSKLINPISFCLLLTLLAGCSNFTYRTEISNPTVTLPAPTLTPTYTKPPASATLLLTATSTPTAEPLPTSTPTVTALPEFTFVVNADSANHNGPGEFDTSQYFRGMCESIAAQPNVAFMVTVGDSTPPWNSRWTIDQYLGSDFLWFPVVGNHELGDKDIEWLRNYNYDPNGSAPPNIVNQGPPGCEQTTFSFDYLNAHFVILNIYCDLNNDRRTDGAIVDLLYSWLLNDLESTPQELIFVFGHEPAFPQPDADAGIIRHLGDSLDQYPITRDRFWELLKTQHVVAYITGHTHSYSVVDIDGVWQVDVGHAMGARTQSTRSTYLLVHVKGSQVTYDTFRVNNFTNAYELSHSGSLR